MVYKDTDDFLNKIREAVSISKEGVKITDKALFKDKILDELIYNLALNENQEIKNEQPKFRR